MSYDPSAPTEAEALVAAWAAVAAANPADPVAHYNHAVACDQAGRPAAAIAALRRSLELDPTAAAAHYNLGCLLLDSGDFASAAAALGEAARLAPEQAFCRFMRGAALAGTGDYLGAFEATVAGVRLQPADPRGQANAGRYAFRLGWHADAAARYLLAVERDDANWGLRLCLGVAAAHYAGLDGMDLPPGPEQTEFVLDDPVDAAKFALAVWAVGDDEVAGSECERVEALDAGWGRKVRAVLDHGRDLRARLHALADRVRAEPGFVEAEARG